MLEPSTLLRRWADCMAGRRRERSSPRTNLTLGSTFLKNWHLFKKKRIIIAEKGWLTLFYNAGGKFQILSGKYQLDHFLIRRISGWTEYWFCLHLIHPFLKYLWKIISNHARGGQNRQKRSYVCVCARKETGLTINDRKCTPTTGHHLLLAAVSFLFFHMSFAMEGTYLFFLY